MFKRFFYNLVQKIKSAFQRDPIVTLPKGNYTENPVQQVPIDPNRPIDLPESNHYSTQDISFLQKEYAYLWSICTINDKFKSEISACAKRIIANKEKYMSVQKAINVPWFLVGAIHYREASLNFNTYLGNGDPLNKKSVHVPAGRGPFSSWEEGAIDALSYEGYAGKSDWSLGVIFKCAEGYNGFGYRTGKMQGTTPKNASPYIYSGTPFYIKGCSIEDHSWYPEAVDGQPGIMAIFKGLAEAGEKLF